MITNTFIPHLICNDFKSFKKGISQLDECQETLTKLELCPNDQAKDFARFVAKFVDFMAMKAFKQGNKNYAYNLRYIKAMLCVGHSANLNGFVGLVSKKSLLEAIQTIEMSHKKPVNYN